MKKNKIYLLVVVFVFFASLILMKLGFDNDAAFSSILTFLSVIIGFSITAMSIIAVSDFSDDLYMMESNENNDMTLFHELVQEYKRAVLLFVFTVFLILVYYFMPKDNQWLVTLPQYELYLKAFVKELVWCFSLLSLFVFVRLFLMFTKFIVRTVAKRSTKINKQ